MPLHLKAQALHDLICAMLRGPHILEMDAENLRVYMVNAGVALHNLPFVVVGDESLTEYQLRDINKLDPNATDGEWGSWAHSLACAFNAPLTTKTA